MKERSAWATPLVGVAVGVGVGTCVGSIWARSADEREHAMRRAAQPLDIL
jgi:hypothetical protein